MTTPQRITTTLAILIALALATSAGPALAREFNLNHHGTYIPAGPTHPTPATTPSATAGTSPTIVRVTAPSRGFDWTDAGIGAAGGFALSMIAIGAALALSQHRTRSPALTS